MRTRSYLCYMHEYVHKILNLIQGNNVSVQFIIQNTFKIDLNKVKNIQIITFMLNITYIQIIM